MMYQVRLDVLLCMRLLIRKQYDYRSTMNTQHSCTWEWSVLSQSNHDKCVSIVRTMQMIHTGCFRRKFGNTRTVQFIAMENQWRFLSHCSLTTWTVRMSRIRRSHKETRFYSTKTRATRNVHVSHITSWRYDAKLFLTENKSYVWIANIRQFDEFLLYIFKFCHSQTRTYLFNFGKLRGIITIFINVKKRLIA